MKITIKQNYDPLFETVMFLYTLHQTPHVELDKKEDLVKATLGKLSQTKQDLLYLQEEMQDFFVPFESQDTCLANLMLFSFYDYHAANLKEAKQTILNKFKTYDLAHFPCFSINGFGLDLEEEYAPFTTSLNQCKFNEKEKFHILSNFLSFETSLEVLFAVLEKAYSHLQGLEFQAFDFETKWSALYEKANQSTLFNYFGIEYLTSDENELILIPTLALPQTMRLENRDHSTQCIMFSGVLLSYEQCVRHIQEGSNQSLKEFLKIIADPSKLSILTLIKENAMYGAEIARECQLTTATISYHINTFVNLQLINLEKKNNRIYYQLNKKQVVKYLKQLEKQLLE